MTETITAPAWAQDNTDLSGKTVLIVVSAKRVSLAHARDDGAWGRALAKMIRRRGQTAVRPPSTGRITP